VVGEESRQNGPVKLPNPFSPYVQTFWRDNHPYCGTCGRNDSFLALHHIRGREKARKYLRSAYNAIMLCNPCHDTYDKKRKGEEAKNFQAYTMNFYKKSGLLDLYQNTKYDEEFLHIYPTNPN
jgi:hypothetical protein